MGVEIRRNADGSLKSKYWYGSYSAGGKRHVENLEVLVEGTPPPSGTDGGDGDFRESRGKAKSELARRIAAMRGKQSSIALVQQLHVLNYGEEIREFPLANVVTAWESMPKKRRTLNERYAKDVKATMQRFLDFMKVNHPRVTDAGQVDRTMAREFLAAEEKRGISDKTWNDSLKRVRATFRFLQADYGVWRNPFDGIRMREEEHTHRKPLTEAQIKALIEAAAQDDFCRPLIVCGLSTAMRLGDCCMLRWADVDLDSPTPGVTVKTSKTGETVCIPIYERLKAELWTARGRAKKDAEFVWPEQAALYQRRHTLVTRKLRRLYGKAMGKKNLRVKRKHSKIQASVLDFHSLRTTWITEALTRGVPIETVKLVSGHKTVEVVTTHYFHPSRDQVRNALAGVMPMTITGGEAKALPPASGGNAQSDATLATTARGPLEYETASDSPGDTLEKALTELDAMTEKNWAKHRVRAAELVRRAKAWVDARVVREANAGVA